MRDIEVDILIAITTDDSLRAQWRQLEAQPSGREAAELFAEIQDSLVGQSPACHPDNLDTWYRALFVLRDRYRGGHSGPVKASGRASAVM